MKKIIIIITALITLALLTVFFLWGTREREVLNTSFYDAAGKTK